MPECQIRLLALLAMIVAAPASALAQAQNGFCAFTPVAICDECELDQDVSVWPGSTCLITKNVAGRFIGIDFPIRPKTGRVGVARNFTIAYQARNAAGEDYFEYVMRYEANGANQHVKIRVHVSIDPDAR